VDLTPFRILDAEALLQKIVGGPALAVVGEEALFEDSALGIQHIGAWVRQPEPVVILGYVGVEYAEGTDHTAAAIGQQRVGDTMPGGVAFQQPGRIRADGEDGNTMAGKVLEIALQLDQLRFAKASPGGAAVEQDEGAVAATGGRKPDGPAKLVRQREVGNQLADAGAAVKVVTAGITAVDEFGHCSSWWGRSRRVAYPLTGRKVELKI
jgi:hypothetical protein